MTDTEIPGRKSRDWQNLAGKPLNELGAALEESISDRHRTLRALRRQDQGAASSLTGDREHRRPDNDQPDTRPP